MISYKQFENIIDKVLEKEDFLSDIMAKELNGTIHAYNKHIGKTIEDLIDRCLSEQKPLATSFTNYDACENNVTKCIRKNMQGIYFWLNNPTKDGIEIHTKISENQPENWGTIVTYDKKKNSLTMMKSNDFTMVLSKNPHSDIGFDGVTFYSNKQCIIEQTSDLTPYIKKTQAWYKAETKMERFSLWAAAKPEPPQYDIVNITKGTYNILDKRSDFCARIRSDGKLFLAKLDEHKRPVPGALSRKDPNARFVPLPLRGFGGPLRSHPGFLDNIKEIMEICKQPLRKKLPDLTEGSRDPVETERKLAEKTNNLRQDNPERSGPKPPGE